MKRKGSNGHPFSTILGEEPRRITALRLKFESGDFTGTTQVTVRGRQKAYLFDLVQGSAEHQNERVVDLWKGGL